jgi:hypothetical protein
MLDIEDELEDELLDIEDELLDTEDALLEDIIEDALELLILEYRKHS